MLCQTARPHETVQEVPLILGDPQRTNAALKRFIRKLDPEVMGVVDADSAVDSPSNDVMTILAHRHSLQGREIL